ncbi:MAG: COQ9 family protein [Pseudobdellovibrionaceae bacterium]
MSISDTTRDAYLEKLLEAMDFERLSVSLMEDVAHELDLPKSYVKACFPDLCESAAKAISGLFTEQMLATLSKQDNDKLKIRERICESIMARFEVMEPHREAVRQLVMYWTRPSRLLTGGGVVWDVADAIWVWAGDTSTDYNRYTKRGLLSGVLTSSMLFWLQLPADHPDKLGTTRAFVARRIENVLEIGKLVGRFTPKKQAS